MVYALLLWSLLTGIYAVLPQEAKDLIPQFNELTAIVSGGATALIGSGGLVFKTWLTKARVEADEKYTDVASKFLIITEKYGELTKAYNSLEKSVKESAKIYEEKIDRLERLVETDLKAKLSNKLIDEKVREMIEGTLDEEEVDL